MNIELQSSVFLPLLVMFEQQLMGSAGFYQVKYSAYQELYYTALKKIIFEF